MADTPPRRRRPTSRSSQDVPGPSPESPPKADTAPAVTAPGRGPQNLQKKLERMLVSMSLPFAAAGDMHCARVFSQRGPIVAEAWANLAAESPAVKEALEAMLKGGAWTGAIFSTVGLLVPVVGHHAPIPPVLASLYNVPQEQHATPEPEPEPVATRTPPPPPESNGNGSHSAVPGPAAFSFSPAPGAGNGDATDPGKYAGNN